MSAAVSQDYNARYKIFSTDGVKKCKPAKPGTGNCPQSVAAYQPSLQSLQSHAQETVHKCCRISAKLA
eukprot:scaffold211492_cov15-Tisochrysis_lutea.AAC.1